MHNAGLVCRKLLKRHMEALFIILFVLADCYLYGWPLIAGTILAVLWVCAPGVVGFLKLPATERAGFVKHFVKTPKVQRLAFLLFWLFAMRYLIEAAVNANLFSFPGGRPGSITNVFLLGGREFTPLAFLGTPFVIYGVACVLVILLRWPLRAIKKDPDLITQRRVWSGITHLVFLTAFVASILSITTYGKGPSYMLSNWLLASGRDANLFNGEASFQPIDSPMPAVDPFGVEGADITKDVSDGAPKPQTDFIDDVAKESSRAGSVDVFEALRAGAEVEIVQQDQDSESNRPYIVTGRGGDVFGKHSEVLRYEDYTQPNTPYELVAPTLNAVDTADQFSDMSFVKPFDTFVVSSLSIAAFLLLFQPVMKLNALLTSFCWRVVSPLSPQNVVEAFLEALRLPTRTLNFREAHPVWSNAGRTLIWVVTCYAALFWIFGFCGGPLGLAIQNWMIASAVDAGISTPDQAAEFLFKPSFRIFLGSIVALYGTAPIAVTAAVFLPCAKPRRIFLNADGITFAQGPFLSLWGRQFRLWSDLKALTVKKLKPKRNQPVRAKFKLTFRSGGAVSFKSSQLSAQDIQVLLDSLDQHSVSCAVQPEVFEVCRALVDADRESAASDGATHSSIASIPAQEFKSTVFVPLAPGELVPNSRTRVIKLLASKPLCAVYLARDEKGRMVIVKQFYLADETEETKALEKILNREYDLLSRLDHPAIAKVLNNFTVDKSTFLVIEHRVGNDLRANVEEHGPRSEGLTLSWAKQLCKIMIYLHSREPAVLHRDLTPDNVIAGEDGQLRLIDFGAAREFLDGITGTMIGKHCYIPPEQLRGEATVRSDIYSFGATLHFLLTGRDPVALSQSSPAQIIDCSEQLDELIRDCTQFDENKRPQSFEEILKRLNAMDLAIFLKIPKVKEAVTV